MEKVMNAVVDQMKQDVGNLMQGGEVNGNDGNTDDSTGFDSAGISNDDTNSGGDAPQVEQLSERDQMELDKALSSGWKQKDDFAGDESDFIRPREWNRTVALYRRIDRGEAERKRLEKEVGSFSDRVKNVMEVAKASAINELESKKREAVESADYEEVRRIDTEIDKTNEDYAVDEPQAAPQQVRAEVEDWMSENTWFEQDEQLTKEALKIQRAQLMDLEDPSNPSSSELSNALKETTRYLRFKFPDKFKQKPRSVAPSLERGGPKSAGKKFGYNDLDESEKKVLAEVERLGGMSRDAYIQAVADMRGSK